MANVPEITLRLGRQRNALSKLLRTIRSRGSFTEEERAEVVRLRTSINSIKDEMIKKGLDPKRAVADARKAVRKAAIKAKLPEKTNRRRGGVGVYGPGSTTRFWS